MKKLLSALMITLMFTATPCASFSQKAGEGAGATGGYADKQAAESKEELYYGIFITLLNPYINNAIDDFYKEYLTYLPSENPWFVEILDIERESFQYVIKLEAAPYIGPHNSVGIDHLTFKVNASGKVTLEKFEHIKSFDIAPNYKSIIKKWPPE